MRFLWVKDLKSDVPDVTVLRFTRVVFSVSASPFLLNATIKHHVEQYSAEYPKLVSLLIRSIYVDDVSFGADDEESAFELYTRSKEILSKGGFNLHKFITNSTLLSHRVELEEQCIEASKHTESKIVGITTRLYDPLGFMSPVIIRIKMFFQELCLNKIE